LGFYTPLANFFLLVNVFKISNLALNRRKFNLMVTYQKVTQWNPEGFLLVTVWFVLILSVAYNGFLTIGFHMVTQF
jgi:hypothetical protein